MKKLLFFDIDGTLVDDDGSGIKIKNIINLIKNEYEVSVFFFMLMLCFVGFSSKTCGH